jgi:N-acetylglutamate synthase-like GNAT family acetyltransferase
MLTVHYASDKNELEGIIDLRYKILRAPWNQPRDTATDDLETRSFNAYLKTPEGNVIACGRLQENDGKVGQIRYMAVDDNFQGKGLGKMILRALEEKAKALQMVKIELQARENAVDFYSSNGYTIQEKTFLLWGLIQHFLMTKHLNDQA